MNCLSMALLYKNGYFIWIQFLIRYFSNEVSRIPARVDYVAGVKYSLNKTQTQLLPIIYKFILFSQLCSVTTINMKNQTNDSEIKGRKIKGLSSSSTKKIAKEEKCGCWPGDSFEDTP